MITGLDHVVVLLSDIEAGAKAYELLLGRAPSWRSQGDGAETVLFTLDNMTLELMAPAGALADGRAHPQRDQDLGRGARQHLFPRRRHREDASQARSAWR